MGLSVYNDFTIKSFYSIYLYIFLDKQQFRDILALTPLGESRVGQTLQTTTVPNPRLGKTSSVLLIRLRKQKKWPV